MQRDTALMLLSAGLVLLLLLVGVALHILAPPSPQPVSQQEPAPTVTPSPPPAFPPTQTVSPISPPAIVTPSLPPTAIGTSATPTVAAIPEKGAFIPKTPAPLPPTPLPPSSLSYLPPAKPPTTVEPETEALRWAKALVASYRPQWRLNLTRSADPTMKGESYAVSVEPNNQVTVDAKSQAGWLYGLLDLAEKLQWRELSSVQWRWTPALVERGLVIENPDWLTKPPRSLQTFQSLLRERLKELAWWRFNTLVLKCDGREPALNIALNTLSRLAPEFNVKVVVWALVISPAVQNWVRQGGQIVTNGYQLNANAIALVNEPEQAVQPVEQGRATVLAAKFVAPNVQPSVFQIKRKQDKLTLLVKLDEGYCDVFWFDPAWAHQLVRRSVRDAGLKGFWLHVRSVPSTWAIAAFAQAVKNPEVDGEVLWQRRWTKRGHQAEKWLLAFREASRVLPELLWLGVATEPQYGASLRSFFTARPIDSSWGFTVLSVTETLKLSRQPDIRTTLTIDEIARRLEHRAQTVWELTAQLPEPSASDWKVAKRLALLNSWLGQFYANKIDAAMAWGRFEAGDKAAGQDCVFHLAKSVRAWEQVVAVANSVYPPNNRWALKLVEFRKELGECRDLIADSMP